MEVLSTYMRETRRGCEKDPSFAKGRNLITYAVDKIGSNSPFDCVSGVKILYTTICIAERKLGSLIEGSDDYNEHRDFLFGQRILMKHLVLSASSSRHILHKLLEMLDSRGVHVRETRHQAAVIMEHLAFRINLEEFPQGIQHISSLIGTFQEYSAAEPYQLDNPFDPLEKHWKLQLIRQLPSPAGNVGNAYKDLLLRGLGILRDLAANENNCRVMSDTRNLISKIMAPLTSDLLHDITDDHGTWSDIVEKSMEVMSKLTSAPGEIGAKLCCEISNCKEAIDTLQRILICNKCNEVLQERSILILTKLYCMDTTESSGSTNFVLLKKESSSSGIGEYFVRTLVEIFMNNSRYSSSIRGYAGKALSEICFRGGIRDAKITVQACGDVDTFTEVLLHDKNEICRQAAAEILEHICTHYILDEGYLSKLKKAILEAIAEILWHGDDRHKGNHGFVKPQIDTESLLDNCWGKGTSSSPPSRPQNDEEMVILGKTHHGKHGFTKPETDTESLLDNGCSKGICSSSSSHPQNNDRKVLGKILSRGDKTHKVGNEAGQDRFAKNNFDIEIDCDGTQENTEQDKTEEGFQAVAQSIKSVDLLSSLLSLCGTVYDTTHNSDLAPQLDASSFVNKLKKVVVEQSDHPTVENLLLCKAISKMVVSMMEHRCIRFIKRGDLESLIEALSHASKNMLNLDHSMVFLSTNSLFATTPSKLDRCTLTSLMKKLHVMVPST